MTQAQKPARKDAAHFSDTDDYDRIFHSEDSHKTDKLPHILY